MLPLPHPRKKSANQIHLYLTNQNSDQSKGLNLLHIFQQSQRLTDLNSSQIADKLVSPFLDFSSFYTTVNKMLRFPFLKLLYLGLPL